MDGFARNLASLTLSLARPLKDPFSMLSRMFHKHGHFCASHPWEVILAFLTGTICMLSVGLTAPMCGLTGECKGAEDGSKGVEVVVLTMARCMAVLYVYHQFRRLYRLGSKYLVGIAGLLTVFSSFVFSSTFVNLLDKNISELNVALPFFLLLMDFSKAGLLAQFALSASSREEVRLNIAQGMAILGPAITLDTLVETLVIGVGMLSDVRRLEHMCCYACMSAVVNYIVFMTFFPACLSLIIELSRDRKEGTPVWRLNSLARVLKQKEEEQMSNPVLQRVKVIMSAGLVLVHARSRWSPLQSAPTAHPAASSQPSSGQATPSWLAVSAEQTAMLVLAAALAIKYIWFETREDSENEPLYRPNSARKKDLFSTTSQPSDSELPKRTSPLRKVSWPLMNTELKPYTVSSDDGGGGCPVASFYLGGDEEDEVAKEESATKRIYAEQSTQTELRTSLVHAGNDATATLTEGETHSDEPGSSTAELLAKKDLKEVAPDSDMEIPRPSKPPRPLGTCLEISKTKGGFSQLTDEEILQLVEARAVAPYKLESVLGSAQRGIAIRRLLISRRAALSTARGASLLKGLPYLNYDYSMVMGTCCENVIGYVPVPLGVAGPLLLDGREYFVPMATTEGCLVASTNRGCRALALSGGAFSVVNDDGMTRGPVVKLPNARQASHVRQWLLREENFRIMKFTFDSTSRYAQLKMIYPQVAGCLLFIRFVASTGDAMGMNMLSKGTEQALKRLQEEFPEMQVLSLSGNYCTDKKPAAINWIMGRGKHVVCEAEVPAKVVREVLKTTPEALVELNLNKNLVGSAIAGSLGGFNSQAANIVTAVYIATGQDPAQNVSSSNCLTQMELREVGEGEEGPSLYASVTMPSLEVGTVGGGTVLGPQAACLELLGVRGPSSDCPGQNAARLAQVIAATVLAGELSLLSALAEGHLVRSHMTHNRSWARKSLDRSAPLPVSSPPSSGTNQSSSQPAA